MSATTDSKQAVRARAGELFDILVPSRGKCDTLQGELLRAAMRINYRWYNDGDFYNSGYGAETAGSSALFIFNHEGLLPEAVEALSSVSERDEENYEAAVDFLLEEVVRYIDRCTEYTPNEEDSVSDFYDKAVEMWGEDENEDDCREDDDEYYY